MFGKKKMTVAELQKAFSDLSEEEREKFKQSITASEPQVAEPTEPKEPSATEPVNPSESPPTEPIADEPLQTVVKEPTEPEPNAPTGKPDPIIEKQSEPEPQVQTEQTLPTEPEPTATDDTPPDEGEFYDGKVEDIPQMIKGECDDSAVYDPNADNVEMVSGDDGGTSQGDSLDVQPMQENMGAEQGDIIAGLQAKITALEAENAQMKAKFGSNFGYGNAPSFAKGRYQTSEDFIKTLPQIRKG